MKIENAKGSNQGLKAICNACETTDISEALDNLKEEEFMKYVRKGAKATIVSVDAATYGVYLAFNENREDALCVASLCGLEEGPDWSKPLNYLEQLLIEEFEKRKITF